MITKKNTIICDECGLFCSYFDEYTPFGCSSYEPPEPLGPSHICKKCFPKVKKRWIESFKKGNRNGDWQKSKAEVEAAKKCGLEWVGNGMGILGTNYFIDGHRYVNKELYDNISKLPYWGWCMKCGNERVGSYCSNKKCENCFESKKELNLKLKNTIDNDKDDSEVSVSDVPV